MRRVHKKEFKALGTDISIFVVTEENAEEAVSNHLQELEKIYREKHERLSRFSANSELSKINSRSGEFLDASEDIIHLSKSSLKFFEDTEGLFDPRVLTVLERIGYKSDFKTSSLEAENASQEMDSLPLENDLVVDGNKVLFRKKIDFSGIAKGYITDLAAAYLAKQGYRNFLVDSGGDMYLAGTNLESEKWRLSLEGVDERRMQLLLEDEAVATSGITRRKWENEAGKFHHLVNPLSVSKFDFDLKSVTFISDKTETADVWAKVLFLMGKREGLEYANEKGLKCIFLDYRGMVSFSKSAKENTLIY